MSEQDIIGSKWMFLAARCGGVPALICCLDKLEAVELYEECAEILAVIKFLCPDCHPKEWRPNQEVRRIILGWGGGELAMLSAWHNSREMLDALGLSRIIEPLNIFPF